MSGVKRHGYSEDSGQKRARVLDGGEDVDVDSSNQSSREDTDTDSDSESDSDSNDGSEDDSDGSGDSDEDALNANQKLQEEQRILATSRELGARMKSDRVKASRAGGLKEAVKHLNKVNEAFNEQQKLRLENKTLEVYDSRNLLESSDLMDIALRNVKLGATRRALQPDEFTRRLKTFLLRTSMRQEINEYDDPEQYFEMKHDFEKFNWFTLGTFAYTRGKKATTTDHLFGLLEIEKKVRKVTPKEKLKVTAALTTAEAVTSEDVNSNANDHTTVAVQDCFKEYQRRANGQTINIYKFFINPHSFAQSVENMFYTSFLLRDGRLMLGEDSEGYPTISFPPPLPTGKEEMEREQNRRRDLHSNHIIFQLEESSWRKLIDMFNITESFLPTRQESQD